MDANTIRTLHRYGAVVGGFVILYVVVGDWSPLLVVMYVLATVGGFALWSWHWREERGTT